MNHKLIFGTIIEIKNPPMLREKEEEWYIKMSPKTFTECVIKKDGKIMSFPIEETVNAAGSKKYKILFDIQMRNKQNKMVTPKK